MSKILMAVTFISSFSYIVQVKRWILWWFPPTGNGTEWDVFPKQQNIRGTSHFLFHSVAIPIGSMYGIFIYSHHPSTIHGGKYTGPMDVWRFTKNWQIQFAVGICLLVKGQDPGLATPQKWSFLAGAFRNSLQIRFWAELHLCNKFVSKQRLLIFLAFSLFMFVNFMIVSYTKYQPRNEIMHVNSPAPKVFNKSLVINLTSFQFLQSWFILVPFCLSL